MMIKILDYHILKQYIEDIVRMEEKVFNTFGFLYDKTSWSSEQFLAERREKDVLSFFILDEGVLKGFSIAYQFTIGNAHISRFAVGPEWASKGLGSSLLDVQLKSMKQQEYQLCSVDLISENSKARKLYESRGFMQLAGSDLLDYINLRNRDKNEYLGEKRSHVALVKYL